MDKHIKPSELSQYTSSNQVISSGPNPLASSPQIINVNAAEIAEIKPASQISRIIIVIVSVILICGGLGLIFGLISPAFNYLVNQTSTTNNNDFNGSVSSSTNSNSNSGTPGTISSTQRTSSTTLSTASTTVTCAYGYTRVPSGTCVNLLIDFNNCGSAGHVCSSNYTSCSGGVCSGAPPVQLVGGVSVPGFGGSISVDDAAVMINLPLAITLYNYSSSNVTISTNGVICLGGCSAAYINTALLTTSFPGPTVLGYWDDLMIYGNTSQSVYYNVVGSAPNRTTTFEFYEAHYSQPYLYYRFQIIFYENLRNVVKFVYFQSSDGGSSATIGVQASSIGPSMTYSFNRNNSITTNMVLTFNTNTGTYTG